MLESFDVAEGKAFDIARAKWQPLLRETPVEPHTRHVWAASATRVATHVRLHIYPDGGVARLRLIGHAAG